MKATKKIVGAACALVAAVALSAGSTFAWFASNKTVSATGMQVQASTIGSLVIGTVAPTANSKQVTVTFSDEAATLRDSTHEADQSTFTTGLKTIADENRDDVVVDSGAYTGTFMSVPKFVSGATKYYTDYTVHIASTAVALTNQTLTVEFTNQSSGVAYADGVAIDIYTTSAEANANYKATAHLASGSNSVSFDVGDIPLANGSSSVVIVMRVYIDGNTEVVKNENYSTSGVSFSVEFTTADKTGA